MKPNIETLSQGADLGARFATFSVFHLYEFFVQIEQYLPYLLFPPIATRTDANYAGRVRTTHALDGAKCIGVHEAQYACLCSLPHFKN